MRPNLFHIPVPAPGRLSTMPRPRGHDWLDDEMTALRGAGVDMLGSDGLTSGETAVQGRIAG